MTRPAPAAARPDDGDQAAALDLRLKELVTLRGGDEVSILELAERLREFVDAYPEFEVPVDRLATWLARLPDDD